MKHRTVHTLQKFLLNQPIKLALTIGLPLPGYALLETKGRKTGKPRRTPVGDGRLGSQLWLVAEHGMKVGYVRNVEHDPHVRLKPREGLRYRWHTGTAHLCSSHFRLLLLKVRVRCNRSVTTAGLEVKPKLSSIASWRHEMGSAERREEVVKRNLVGDIDSCESETPLILITVK
jgi:deazaflavin-dependent oxidoreductase (nitroreductase family)